MTHFRARTRPRRRRGRLATGSLVSGSYFSVLGVTPVMDRMIVPQDDEPIGTAGSSECAMVVSHDLWTRRLGASPSVLGRRVEVGTITCAVVGVMPQAFDAHQMGHHPDVWVPLRTLTDPKVLASRTSNFFRGVIGRLRPGVERSQAEAELNTLFQRISVTNETSAGQTPPSPGEFRLRVLPGARGLDAIRRQFSEPLRIVMGIAAVVLLIAWSMCRPCSSRSAEPGFASSRRAWRSGPPGRI